MGQTHATPGRHTAPLLSHVRTRRHLQVLCTSIGLLAVRDSAALSNARPKRSHPSRWATRLADRGGDRESTPELLDLSVGGWVPIRLGTCLDCSPVARRGSSHWQRLRFSGLGLRRRSIVRSCRCASSARRPGAGFPPSQQGEDDRIAARPGLAANTDRTDQGVRLGVTERPCLRAALAFKST